MSIEKITINGHYIWVDEDADTMTNTPMGYCYNSLKSQSDWENEDIVLHQGVMPIYHYRGLQKIIAASPELKLEGVPTYVEWLAEQEFPLIDESRCRTGDAHEENLQLLSHRRTFLKGYNLAQCEQWLSPIESEKQWQEEQLAKIFSGYPNALQPWQYLNTLIKSYIDRPTWDDVRKAITMARETEYGLIKSKEEIIEQLKQQKLNIKL